MGKAKNETKIGRLIPKSVEIKTDSGIVVVAGNAEENRILNFVVAAQIRDMLQSSIKKYKDSDAQLTPKELKDLAEAGKSLAEFSAEIYKGDSALDGNKTEKKVEPDVADGDFSAIKPSATVIEIPPDTKP